MPAMPAMPARPRLGRDAAGGALPSAATKGPGGTAAQQPSRPDYAAKTGQNKGGSLEQSRQASRSSGDWDGDGEGDGAGGGPSEAWRAGATGERSV